MMKGQAGQLTVDEVRRVDRVRLAVLLHKLPHEIDAAPFQDIVDLIEVQNGEVKYRQLEQVRRK